MKGIFITVLLSLILLSFVVSAQEGFKVIPPAQCREGESYVFGNAISDCKDGKLVDREYCQYGAGADANGNWICNQAPSQHCKDYPNTPECGGGSEDNSGGINVIGILGLIAIVVYIAYRFGQKNVKKKK